jgi:hypothetical protein
VATNIKLLPGKLQRPGETLDNHYWRINKGNI